MCLAERRKRVWRALIAVPALLGLTASPVFAAKTGSWTTTSPHVTTTSNGIRITMTPATVFTAATAGTMGATNFWNDPYAATPTASIPGTADLDFTLAAVASQQVTITFSEAVDNPVLHVERLGGTASGATNSSNWQLTGSNLATLPTMSKLAGNPQFRVTTNSFFRPSGLTPGATGCSNASATATTDDGSNGCGSVRFAGTGITSLTFTITFVGGLGIGDGLEMVWSTGGSRVAIAKESTYGTRVFSFTGTNGVSSVTLDTGVANPNTSAWFNVTDHRNPITITEGSTTDYTLTGVSCVDQNAAVVTATLSGLTLTIPSANYQGNQSIVCTFRNRRIPAADLTIVKSNGVSTVYSGSNVTYNLVVTNTGPDTVTGAVVTDLPGAGITCLAASPVTITGSGVPTGSFTFANLSGAGIALAALATGQSATLTFTCKVN